MLRLCRSRNYPWRCVAYRKPGDGGLYSTAQTNCSAEHFRQDAELDLLFSIPLFRDRGDQRLFDTNEFAFSYAHDSADNRFSGSDRISDANSVDPGRNEQNPR